MPGKPKPADVIISGSNMSGKSTLLRTVGLNAVLAFAGAPVRAKRMRYTIELTRGLHEANPRRVERLLKQLGKLQSALGQLNDLASARTILHRIAVEAKAGPKNVEARVTSGPVTKIAAKSRK